MEEIAMSYSYFNHTSVSYPITMATQYQHDRCLFYHFILLGAVVDRHVTVTGTKELRDRKNIGNINLLTSVQKEMIAWGGYVLIYSSCRICTNYMCMCAYN